MAMRIERVFPTNRAPGDDSNARKDVVLSLLDATAANFSPTGAVWFLEKPDERLPSPANVVEHLRSALTTTLNAYPQWCGHLQALPYRPDEGTTHLHRFGRLQLSFGSSTDPGAELVTANSSASLDELFGDRKCSSPFRDMRQIPWDELIPATQLAAPLSDTAGDIKPSLAIQITTLACGGTVLAAKMSHPLGDAHTLAHFVDDWSRIAKANIIKAPLPTLSPIFQPALLDRQAAGDIDQPIADERLIGRANALPFHRYDWWLESKGCPWPVIPPEPFRSQPLKPAGKPMPWHEWDVTAPVSHDVVHFSAEQIQRLWDFASNGGIVPSVSRHDAVVAHIWSCINRARGINNNNLDDEEELVHCDLVYGVRERLSLGEYFLGSPLVMLDISSSSLSLDSRSLALSIREALHKISPDDIRAHLHSVAYEDCPQRLWQAFLGRRHILVTSWVQTDVYKVDFGAGMVSRYVEAIMPDLDGIVQVMTGSGGRGRDEEKEEEASGGVVGKEEGDRKRTSTSTRKAWYRDGVDISLHICSNAMEKLLRDPYLFP